MRSPLRAALSVATLATIVLGTGCASTPATRKGPVSRILFPPPPAQPVIEWVASYASASDVGAGQGSFTKILVGKEEREPALIAPTSVAIAPDGSLFVVDQRLEAVVIVDPVKKRFEAFRGDGSAAIAQPVGVAFGPDGSLYVSDASSRSVASFDANLQLKALFGGPKVFTRPTGVAVSRDGKRLAVCDTPKDVVYILSTADGKVIRKLGVEGGSQRPGEFKTPYAVAFDDDGFLHVSDYLNFRVQVFGRDGTFEGTWGRAGDRPGELNRPRGLDVDSKNGIVYEVDGAFQVVQMFNLDGELLMWFGSPGEGPGQLSLPTGISRRGDLIAVADTLNRRVQLFRFLGMPKK